jgi:uncharacterized membrane protein
MGAILLAWAISWVDLRIPNETLETSRLILVGTPKELRSNLVSMATTILATAGVVFTLLTLPLSTVAAQYGSRLLRVFLGDRTSQLVLGMFAGTFVYCLAAALSIPPEEVQPEGPQLTATVGLFLMVATFASLILLVQHVSTMLQAPNIAAAAGAQLRGVVLAEMPETLSSESGRQASEEAAAALAEEDGRPVRVRQTGYIEYVDPAAVLDLARASDLVIRLLLKPGGFVTRGEVVALVWPEARVDERLARQIRGAFRIGNARTPTQDLVYGVNQLVEMAVRAMSPAINDPFTAMTCLDYIGEGLTLLIRQGLRGAHYCDPEGRLRLVLEPVTFGELLDAAFDMLRHASRDNASVLLHMLEVIDIIGEAAGSPPAKDPVQARQPLLRHVSVIQSECLAGQLAEQDRQSIQLRTEALTKKWG